MWRKKVPSTGARRRCTMSDLVIPERHEVASPESIATNREYGFRAPSLRSSPGMTVIVA